jgi:hypothetical protein
LKPIPSKTTVQLARGKETSRRVERTIAAIVADWRCWFILSALIRAALLHTSGLPLHDFISYWAAAILFWNGGNPYSADAMLALERLHGWRNDWPLMLLCPPWTLPVIGIVAAADLRAAQIAWMGASFLLNCLSAVGLWRYFGGRLRQAWIPLAIVGTFIPVIGAEYMGQITPLILASLTAFLWLIRRERYFFAGLTLIGFGLKPHLLYLVSIAVLLWSIRNRRWAVLGGASLVYLGLTTASIAINGHVLGYIGGTYGAAMDTVCGVGGVLREIFGLQRMWLQFVPTIAGFIWFGWYWAANRTHWNWAEHLPLLTLVSVAASPYCWSHDFTLVLPVLIQFAVKISRSSDARNYSLAIAIYLTVAIFISFFSGLSKAWMAAANTAWIALYYAPGWLTSDRPPSSS